MVTNEYNDRGYFGSGFREFRHNPCLMTPVSLFMFMLFGLFLLLTLLFQVPTLLLGLLLGPVLQRNAWFVEFLYPWSIARWAHFFLNSQVSKRGRTDDKNRGFHSRTVEQKVEVIPGRVYIHPIPQFLDNLGYLVVCLPKPKVERRPGVRITIEDDADPIVSFIIDCGEFEGIQRAVKLVQDHHYGKRSVNILSILSTHKHHDHTGGNLAMLSNPSGPKITRVFGGAVERIPGCTDFLSNGDKLVLPKLQNNDMNDLIEVEAVAVPAHTRGSIVFRLRSKESDHAEFLFTGDTMFCGGAGVPFEADVGVETEPYLNKCHGHTHIRTNIGSAATERCFAELLVRALPKDSETDAGDRVLVFPGHEYASELLSRQFTTNVTEACRWKNFAPKTFFSTVSQLYIAMHRRSLPHNSGKLLMIPTTLNREVSISPHFRSLQKSGELVVRAVSFWHDTFCQNRVRAFSRKNSDRKRKKSKGLKSPGRKITSTPRRWNLAVSDVNRDIFTTVFTADLEGVIDELGSGSLSKKEAAQRLRDLTRKMDQPLINKRAIPGYLPSDKTIYRGIAGLVLLGSPPAAMTYSDSSKMNLPAPIDSNSDRIRISKSRLIFVLRRLGLLEADDGDDDVAAIIEQLWTEASAYIEDDTAYSIDEESGVDEIEIGVLKWVIYGVPANQPSWFSKMCCMPCSSTLPKLPDFPSHPVENMKQKNGDLVSHDVLNCMLCRDVTGRVTVDRSTKLPSIRGTSSRDSEETMPEEEGLEVTNM